MGLRLESDAKEIALKTLCSNVRAEYLLRLRRLDVQQALQQTSHELRHVPAVRQIGKILIPHLEAVSIWLDTDIEAVYYRSTRARG